MATPEPWENATPVYGIRYPKSNAPAKHIPAAFNHSAIDLETALLTIPSVPGLNYTTGTNAQRLVATPTKDLIWIETDTGDRFIGTGSAWLELIDNTPGPWIERPTGTAWIVYSPPGAYRMVGKTVEVRGQTIGRNTTVLLMNPGQANAVSTANPYPLPAAGATVRAVGILAASASRGVASVEISGTDGGLRVASVLNAAANLNPSATHNWDNCIVIPNFTYTAA